ncbi:MAG TPA: formate dehydrogenase subunit delta [Rhizobacter sp.]|nr:formate dehydrogenase subunit delta [Rhizobacter sp.]
MSNDQNILIRMANQIGSFFEAMPDRAEALQDVATHLKKFWAPRMRQDLLAHVDAHGADDLHFMVAEAVSVHRSAIV